ncbi:hypothetical protein HG536_0D04240 [Torulaspora globosa]|uniref:Vacuolar protein sorting-associated protein 8 central domain-containing protein n=1 Tax=Torulaspora globosa TaxID=48254 RepID=A0A7G3ZHB6_9SACH|nr:uncharacterized protein HG536_0D04240 [Torulaspora globosa]QLL32902.1 hypothetical protein HG536_0D04240 [Torulaspora globosa]
MGDEPFEKKVNSGVVMSERSSFLDFRCTSHSSEKAKTDSAEEIPHLTNSSQGSDTNLFKNPKHAASLIRWKDYNDIYPALGAYGRPSIIYPTKYCCVFGTTRGPILIFSVKQILLSKLIPQIAMSNAENDYIHSEVSHIAVSADGTHLTAAYKSGDVFIWNLNASESSSSPSSISSVITEPLRAILHITNHCGKGINGIGFVGGRHTALVVSDDSGQILLHNGFRSRLWSLTYSSRTIAKFSTGQLLRSELGPYETGKNYSQLIAVVTRTNMGIICLDPKPVTLFVEDIAAKTSGIPLTNSCLSWSKNGCLVALSLNSSLYTFMFSSSRPFALLGKGASATNGAIISLQWINDQALGIMTVSHQLLMVDITRDCLPVMDLDLLMYDLLIPPDKHVAVRDTEIYALTHYNLKIGKFATWMDVTLHRVQNADYIGALNFFETLLKLRSPLAELIKLESEQTKREDQLGQLFFNLALAALRFIFENSNVDYDDLYQLFSTVLRIIGLFEDKFVRSTYFDSFIEQSLEYFNKENVEVLYEVLVNYVTAGLLSSLPPVVFKDMLEFYAKRKRTAIVEELIMMLNPNRLDIDFAVKICKEYGLFDVLVYIWTKIFGDHMTPLVDALCKISEMPEESSLFNNVPVDETEKIYDYLSFTLTGRQYPDGTPINSRQLELEAKTDLYQVIFNGSCVEWPPGSSQKLRTKREQSDEPAFPYFNLLLGYNPLRCLATFNEAFEDSCLNSSEVNVNEEEQKLPVTRQTIIYIMLDMMRKKKKGSSPEATLLAIFISTNAFKYPQFIRLNKQDFENLIDVLCQSEQPSLDADKQRALESILALYAPTNVNQFIKKLEEKKFTRVLFNVYIKARKFVDLFRLTIRSEDASRDFGMNMASITQLVLKETKEDPVAHSSISEIIEDKFTLLLRRLGPKKAALLFEGFDYQLHYCVTSVMDKDVQLEYLDQAFKVSSSPQSDQGIKKLYIELTIHQKNKEKVLSWLHNVDLKSVDAQHILSLLIADQKHEEAYVMHYRLGMFSSVVDDMLFCIEEWFQNNNGRFETLDKYLTAAVDAANSSKQDKKLNWTKLTACFFNLFGSYAADASKRKACKHALQKLFIKLAVSDNSVKEQESGKAENILTNVLEHQDIIMKRIQDLKELLLDIFAAYNIEQHISKLILKILQSSSTSMIYYYKDHVQNGQSICNHECVICGRKIWGLGLDTKVFEMWETASSKYANSLDMGGTAIVLFFCRHSFHRECLENLGQHAEAYFCLTCNKKDKNSG